MLQLSGSTPCLAPNTGVPSSSQLLRSHLCPHYQGPLLALTIRISPCFGCWGYQGPFPAPNFGVSDCPSYLCLFPISTIRIPSLFQLLGSYPGYRGPSLPRLLWIPGAWWPGCPGFGDTFPPSPSSWRQRGLPGCAGRAGAALPRRGYLKGHCKH